MQLRVAASSPSSLPAPVALGVLVLLVVLLLGDAAPLLSHLPLRAGSRRLWVAGAGEGGGAGARGARAGRRRAAALLPGRRSRRRPLRHRRRRVRRGPGRPAARR